MNLKAMIHYHNESNPYNTEENTTLCTCLNRNMKKKNLTAKKKKIHI